MTIKEAILKSLEDIHDAAGYMDVYNHIVKNNYYEFKIGKTPENTVSALLGSFIRTGDSRVKRTKQNGETYSYYLTKYEEDIEYIIRLEKAKATAKEIKEKLVNRVSEPSPAYGNATFSERDLHTLLSSYLNSINTYSKTIYHEQSKNSKDSSRIWTHPDMVAVKFLKLKTKTSQNLLKSVNKEDIFKLSSYELKKEINTDGELKKAYFQAVSNSSWANYGYLAAFEFSSDLYDEMERLNQSFGIGIIELNANPFLSKILYTAKYRSLDFNTIDKLCNINPDFEQFIEQIDKLMTAGNRYYSACEKELEELCDMYLTTDSEIEAYCKNTGIPYEADNGEL